MLRDLASFLNERLRCLLRRDEQEEFPEEYQPKPRGHAPDSRNVKDIMAIDECPSCRAAPAAVIATDDETEGYQCGGEVR